MNTVKKLAAIAVLCGVFFKTSAADSLPAPPYQWRNVVIGGGGFVTGLIAHPQAKDLLYARTDVGGAYRWEAAAQRWTPLTDSFSDWDFTGVESLALDPADTNCVYLAAGIYQPTKAAIFRSADRGRTWQRTDVPFKMGANEEGRFNGERLAVDPHDGNILFFGSRHDGLWQSVDRGATWAQAASFPRTDSATAATAGGEQQGVGIVCVQFDPASGRANTPTPVIYTAVSAPGTNFFRSADGGKSWQAVPGQPTSLRPNHVVRAGDGKLYLSYGKESGPSDMGDGAVWKFDPANNSWTDITPLKSPVNGQSFGYGAVAVDIQHPAVILATTFCRWHPHDEIFRSTNSGATWMSLLDQAQYDHSSASYTANITPHWLGSVLVDSDQAWFTTGYGLWHCTNLTAADSGGATRWNFSDNGLEETVPLALVSPPAGAHLLSGVGDIDGFRHDDPEVSPAHGAFAGPRFSSTRSIVFAARQPQIVVRVGDGPADMVHAAISADSGTTWQLLESDPTPEQEGSAVAVSCDGKIIVWTTRYGVAHVTADRGKSWSECAGLAAGICVVADTVNPARFYAFEPATGKMFASTNAAASFAAAEAALPPARRDVHASANLTVTPGREGDVWLAFGGRGLWHSTNGGASFVRLEKVGAASALGLGKAAAGKGFPALFLSGKTGSQSGLFRSDDAGQTWLRINDDAHQFGRAVKVTGDPRIFGRVYLATSGRGIIYGEPAAAAP